MSKFENLKDKALSALGTIIDKSANIYEYAEEKAKFLAKTTKLKAEIAKDNSDLKKLYADLGSLYYCIHKDDPDEALSQLCGEIKAVLDKIEFKQRELEELSEQVKEIEVDITVSEETPDEPSNNASSDEEDK